MINPILRIRLSIQFRLLNINILITRIKIHIADPGRLARRRMRNIDTFEKGRNDEIDVLTRVGRESHHGEGEKGAHGSRIVVSGQTVKSGGEETWDVEVGAFGGETGTAGVVVLVDGEKGGFVANVSDIFLVEVFETGNESLGAAEGGDEFGHVVGNVKGVFPNGGFVGFGSGVLETAGFGGAVVDVGAVERVLVSPGLVQIFGLEEAREARVFGGVEEDGGLVGTEEVDPVAARGLILFDVALLTESGCNGGDAVVVVAVLQCAGNRAGGSAKSFVVKILHGNVVECFPAVQATTALTAPICEQRVISSPCPAFFHSCVNVRYSPYGSSSASRTTASYALFQSMLVDFSLA